MGSVATASKPAGDEIFTVLFIPHTPTPCPQHLTLPIPLTHNPSFQAKLRMGSVATGSKPDGDEIAITDNGNYIVDLFFKEPIKARGLTSPPHPPRPPIPLHTHTHIHASSPSHFASAYTNISNYIADLFLNELIKGRSVDPCPTSSVLFHSCGMLGSSHPPPPSQDPVAAATDPPLHALPFLIVHTRPRLHRTRWPLQRTRPYTPFHS
jgi:hypothetical protein